MVRRARAFIVAAALLVSLLCPPGAVSASTDVQVLFNGEPVTFDVPPQIRNDRTFVPVRFVLERIQAEIQWDGEARQVHITSGGKHVVLTVGSKQVVVDGQLVEIDVAPFIEKDRTMVPLRFLAETFGFEVSFDAQIRTVLLIPPAKFGGAVATPTAPPVSTVGVKPAVPVPPVPAKPVPTKPAPALPAPPTSPSARPTSPPVTAVTPAPTAPAPVAPAPVTPAPVTPQPRGTVRVTAPATARVGETITVAFVLEGFPEVIEGLLYLRFDSSRLRAVDLRPGGALDGLALNQDFNNTAGLVRYVSAKPGSSTFSGNGTLFEVDFIAQAVGTIQLSLPAAGQELRFGDKEHEPIALTTVGAAITITP